MFMVRFYF